MWEQILEAAAGNGIWALMFIALFFVQIKDSKTREEKYQATIEALADKLSVVTDIKEIVESIDFKVKTNQESDIGKTKTE